MKKELLFTSVKKKKKSKSECIALSFLNIASLNTKKTWSDIHTFCGYFSTKQIKPKVDPWQQKLLIKMTQWKKVDKMLDIHSKFVEVK